MKGLGIVDEQPFIARSSTAASALDGSTRVEELISQTFPNFSSYSPHTQSIIKLITDQIINLGTAGGKFSIIEVLAKIAENITNQDDVDLIRAELEGYTLKLMFDIEEAKKEARLKKGLVSKFKV